MAPTSTVLFTVSLIFNFIPSSSLTHVTTPDCVGIQVLCNRPIRSCCNGQCCPFMKEFQVDHVTLPSLTLTASQYAEEWRAEHSSSSLPTRNQQCLASSPEPYQCADGGPTGSLRCKFDGTMTTEGVLKGSCKVTSGSSGCRRDSDCYHFNDVCKSSKCVEGTSSSSSAAKSSLNIADNLNELQIEPPTEDESAAEHTANGHGKHVLMQWNEMSNNAQAAMIFACLAALVLVCIVLKCCYMTCAVNKGVLRGNSVYDDRLSHIDRKHSQDEVSYDVEHGVSALDHVNESSDDLAE